MGTNRISGDLVFLEPLKSEEKIQIIDWNKDPEVSKYTEPWDFSEIDSKSISFGIHDKISSKLIGDVGISSIDLKNKHAEIGLTIGNKNCWGKGFGTDTVKTILKYCFEDLKLIKIFLDVWVENERAIGCYIKCGFKKDGILREHVFKDGTYHDKLIMSILDREYKKHVSPTRNFLSLKGSVKSLRKSSDKKMDKNILSYVKDAR
ncbi:MAG: GNAT family protein [Candidatus Shapirobacteria bacterium]|jgi:RimJ/RimL family protein N-acetyltransferase